ncbi:MAG: LysE family transporter [Cyclobacteriaceae bacterium]|nr:LysE family transporter [Cyclobacteriaceae bacterium]
MAYVTAFLLGFFFSFIGSIPPGTLNLTVLQLGLEKRIQTALRFSLAVAIVEYPYAWIGVHFEYLISSSPIIVQHFELIAAAVMLALAVFNLLPDRKPTGFAKKFSESGFRRGLVLSILNPMAIPYWMAFTAYMKLHGWIELSSPLMLHVYVFGTALGAMALLSLLIFFANRLAPYVQGSKWVKIIPGLVLLALGLYALFRYFFI